MFEILQSRLPIELRLAGVSSIQEANVFLNSYIKKYNARFSISSDNVKSVFELQPSDEKINLILAILAYRKIDNGHWIRFNNSFFKLFDSFDVPAFYQKSTPAMVVRAFDGLLFACINEKVFSLELVPSHELVSRNFVLDYVSPAPIKRAIPSMDHPWKLASFFKFVRKKKHHYQQDFLSNANSQALIYDF